MALPPTSSADRLEPDRPHALTAGGDVAVGGDVVLGSQVNYNFITAIVQGLGEWGGRGVGGADGQVRNFLEHYLGAAGRRAPFGGRRAALAQLDQWLGDPSQPPYGLLAAPAGLGKSALLAHWVEQLAGRAGLHVVYFPISIRYGTNREVDVLAALAARLAWVHDETAWPSAEAGLYRSLVLDDLRRPPADGGRLLLVVDGLDEAAWDLGAELFPTEPPAHLRILAAGRPRAGDDGAQGWLNRLGWGGPARARVFNLGGLDPAGVREVLIQMGGPLDALAADGEAAARLHALSAGDPLLVRLYLEALRPQGDQAALLRPEDLPRLKPGLADFLGLWLDDQRKLWGQDRFEEDRVFALLSLCALAHGPLTVADLRALAPDYYKHGEAVRAAARTVSRFLVGDGQQHGYVFSHPRLAEYFAERLEQAGELAEWQTRFVEYGRATLAQLKAGSLKPAQVSPYLVRYFGVHLDHAQAPPSDFYALVSEAWLQAWEWLEGAPDGFLNDVRRAWHQAEAAGAAGLGQQARAALCFASLATLSGNVPAGLIVAGVRAGVLSVRLARYWVANKPEAVERLGCLTALASVVPEDERPAVLAEALRAARAAAAGRTPPKEFARLIEVLRPAEADLLREALAIVRGLSDGGARAELLSLLARRLPADAGGLWTDVLAAVATLQAQYNYAVTLSPIITQMPAGDHALWDQALAAVRAVPEAGDRAEVLCAAAGRLPPAERDPLLTEALTLARGIDYGDRRFRVAATVAALLPEARQTEVMIEILTEALAGVPAIPVPYQQARALAAVADWLPEGAVDLAAAVAAAGRAVPQLQAKAVILGLAAARLAGAEQEQVLRDALAAVVDIPEEAAQTRILLDLGRQWPASLSPSLLAASQALPANRRPLTLLAVIARHQAPDAQQAAWREALTAAGLGPEDEVIAAGLELLAEAAPAEALAGLAEVQATPRGRRREQLPTQVLPAVIESLPTLDSRRLARLIALAGRLPAESDRADVLAALVNRLPASDAGLFLQVLPAAGALENETERGKVLAAIAERGPRHAELLNRLVEAAETVEFEYGRRDILRPLARPGSAPEPELWSRLKTAAQTLTASDLRAELLEALAAEAPAQDRPATLAAAVEAARSIQDLSTRVEYLGRLAGQPGGDLAREALAAELAAARAVADSDVRARVLSATAEYISDRAAQMAVFAEAIQVAQNIAIEGVQVQVLADLCDRLPPEAVAAVTQLLPVVETLWRDDSQAQLLSAIARRIPAHAVELLAQALALAGAIRSSGFRARALAAVAGRLPADARDLLAAALDQARGLSDPWSKAEVLGALAGRLPPARQPAVWAEALRAARAIQNPGRRAQVLGALSARLPERDWPAVLAEALAIARAIPDLAARLWALNEIAAKAPEPARPAVAAEASVVAEAIDRNNLADWAERQSEREKNPPAEDTELEWDPPLSPPAESEREPAQALSVLIEALAVERSAGALLAAWQLALTSAVTARRAWALGRLAPWWAELSQAAGQSEASLIAAALRASTPVGRPHLLRVIEALLPVIRERGGEPAVSQVAEAIVETARWWP